MHRIKTNLVLVMRMLEWVGYNFHVNHNQWKFSLMQNCLIVSRLLLISQTTSIYPPLRLSGLPSPTTDPRPVNILLYIHSVVYVVQHISYSVSRIHILSY